MAKSHFEQCRDKYLCEIWGSDSSVSYNSIFLEYDAASLTFWGNVLPSSSWSGSQRRVHVWWDGDWH